MYFQIKGFKIKRTYTMQSTFKNLLYVLRHYKLATVTNLLGLSFAFLLFMLISIHVGHEYSFDASLLNRERIFQLENKRDDGIWEANFARPQLERFIAASPYIEAAAITVKGPTHGAIWSRWNGSPRDIPRSLASNWWPAIRIA